MYTIKTGKQGENSYNMQYIMEMEGKGDINVIKAKHYIADKVFQLIRDGRIF